jgi:SAM-dependent methyltransferase
MSGSAPPTAPVTAPAADSPYTDDFFRWNAQSAAKSARPILELVHRLYRPTSIVDIGCGSGGWLAAAEQIGFTVLRGYDGPWADPARYTSANIDFRPVNLEQDSFEHDRRYDLAMSVEVAEHLSEPRADVIVDLLCAASDVVLFGAAIPMQGGTHHIHERPQTYWIEKFRKRGFEPFDVIRPAIWNDNNIRWWFRQNTILFVKAGSDVLDRDLLRSMEKRIWNVVHPAAFQRKVRNWRETAAELRSARREIARLEERERRLQRRVDSLQARMQTMRPPRRTLSTVKPGDLPAPLRPIAVKAWHALPPSARALVRHRR